MNIKDIKKIIFECENYAVITFDLKDIIAMTFSNIEKDGDDLYYIDKTNIVISKKANKKSKYKNYEPIEIDLFSEIMRLPNIQEIIICTKKKNISICPIYDDYSFMRNGTNDFQKSKLDESGNLIIDIQKGNFDYNNQ